MKDCFIRNMTGAPLDQRSGRNRRHSNSHQNLQPKCFEVGNHHVVQHVLTGVTEVVSPGQKSVNTRGHAEFKVNTTPSFEWSRNV
jgi:hypothetical protein